MITKTFDQPGPFAAFNAADAWCAENGISIGRTAGIGNPIGLMYGNVDISKWYNLSKQDIAELDGRITGNFREGPITLTIRERAE